MKVLYFSYLCSDLKAMEQCLDHLAQKGWALQWLRFGFAGFSPTDRADLRYTVELAPPRAPDEEEERADWEYRQLCADAGWEVAAVNRTYRVFASKEGADPLPMDTDSSLTFRAKWDRTLLWRGLGYFLLAAFNLFFHVPNCLRSPSWSRRWFTPYYVALMLLSGGLFLFQGAWDLWTRRKFRQAADRGDPLPVLSPRFALVRSTIWNCTALLLVLLMVAIVLF